MPANFVPGGMPLPRYPWYALPPGADKVPGSASPLVAPPHAGFPVSVAPGQPSGGGGGPAEEYQLPPVPPPNLAVGARAMGFMG